ncbi:MAG: caspase family protein [Alphaproteobacteria bacterium]|nr:caspase family protein [Alphaproteobacteria bacterium]
MRKALIVGVDFYQSVSPLYGCVADAHAVKSALDRHSDGSVNFHTRLMAATGPADAIARAELKSAVRELFEGDSETALFFFAGHGHVEAAGGYLCASDSKTGDDGLSLIELLAFANNSRARNKVIILDSCHSGIAGSPPGRRDQAELTEGMTILTASTAEQYASEENGAGVFTTLLVDALNGAAANLVGDITPGSVYAHIDQSLGPWKQRPVFKTNVKNFVSLKTVQPPIPLDQLRRLPEFFPLSGHEFPLDPAYEPKGPNPDPTKTTAFAILQRYNRVNLVVPIGAPHMYDAAMESKSCKLTVLGEHYRRLVADGLI